MIHVNFSRRSFHLLICGVFQLLLLSVGCARDSQEVVFMAGFKAQANLPFVAAYVAQEKGFFEVQGLSVKILHANRGEHLKLMMAGDVDFTTAAATSATA